MRMIKTFCMIFLVVFNANDTHGQSVPSNNDTNYIKEILINNYLDSLTKSRSFGNSLRYWSHPECNINGCLNCHTPRLPDFMRYYYLIYSCFDSTIADSCFILFDKKLDESLDSRIKEGESINGRSPVLYYLNPYFKKSEKRLYFCFKSWVRRMNKNGLNFMIRNEIDPLKGSRVIWKKG